MEKQTITLELKELEIEFEGKGEYSQKGYHFKQISKHGWGYLYEKSHSGGKHYEVFKRKKKYNPYTGLEYVMYPSDGAFGHWAWTCMTLERAMERFIGLIEVKDFEVLNSHCPSEISAI